jgi:hypothetical protein
MERNVAQALRARTRAMVAGVLIGAAPLVPPAGAASVDLTAGVLSYRTRDAVSDTLVVSLAGGAYRFDDPTGTLVPSSNALAAGCVAHDANTIACPASAVTSLDFDARVGDDSIVLERRRPPGGPRSKRR